MTARPRRLAAVALAAALATTGLGALPGVAAAGDVVLTGRGYGHGIGMSQYGAKGRAEAGQSYATILAAYYPGTTLATGSDAASITVWLQEDTDNEVRVVAEPGMTIQGTDPATSVVNPVVTLPATIAGAGGVQVTPTVWRLRLVSRNLVLEGYHNGAWYPHGSEAVDATLWAVNRGTFAAPDGTVRLITGSTYREHKGVIQANRPAGTDTLYATVTLPMGEYLKSVVKAEMPATWHAEAVRAQAVAARTYAMYERDVASRPWWYDTCNSTSCQVYRGVADYTGAGARTTEHQHRDSDAAVAATAGKYLAYGGKPAFTQFSASNGGYTVAGSQPYLVAAPDPYDAYPTWTVTLTKAAIEAKYPTIGTFTGLAVTRDGKGSYGGRVVTVTVQGTKGLTSVSGATFRSQWGLKSTLWTSSSVTLPPKPPIATPQRDWNADGLADLIGRAPDGKLYLYSGRGSGTWASRVQIGNGWHVMGLMTQVHNFSGTRLPEIITTDPRTGTLRLYPGNGKGGFGTPRNIGNGWQGFTALVGVQGWHGAGLPGLIARDPKGNLRLYPGNGKGGFAAMRVIGNGWNVMDVMAFGGDLTGDGRVDLIARETSSGTLWIYPGNGTGGFLARRQLPGDWSGYDVILGGADWSRDGRYDLIAREAATGKLWLFPGDGAGSLLAPRQVGNGWTGFTIIG
jgi:SpoIID/LytB domain protein